MTTSDLIIEMRPPRMMISVAHRATFLALLQDPIKSARGCWWEISGSVFSFVGPKLKHNVAVVN